MKTYKILAILCASLVLILLLASSVKQIMWNQVRYDFSPHGQVAKANNQFLFGVDKIIRGDQVWKIIQDLSPETSPDIGYEYILVKMKVKNISRKDSYSDYFAFHLFSMNHKNEKSYYKAVYVNFPYSGEYARIDTSVVFLPGDTWYDSSVYQIKKGEIPGFIDIVTKYEDNALRIHRWINLQDLQISNQDLFIFCFWLAYIVSLWVIWKTIKQREKRSDGVSGYLVPIFVILFIPLITLLVIDPRSFLTNQFLVIYFVVLNIVSITIYLLAKKTYLVQFNWLSKENMKNLIDEFIVLMGWDESVKTQKKNTITIQNPNNQEKYVIENNSILIKNRTKDFQNVKDPLIKLFSSSPIDWYSFYKVSTIIYFSFLVYFALILVLSSYYL